MSKEVVLDVYGMTCSNCATHVQNDIKKVKGVKEVNVNLLLEKAHIVSDDSLDEKELIKVVKNAGFKAYLRLDTGSKNETSNKFSQLTTQIILTAISIVISGIFGFYMLVGSHNIWVMLAITTIMQFGVGFKFYVRSFYAIRSLEGNMDVLVALGTSLAYFFSLYMVFFENDRSMVYFETTIVLITVIMIGNLIEDFSRVWARTKVHNLPNLENKYALVKVNGEFSKKNIKEVIVGDTIKVLENDKILFDGVIEYGETTIDESSMTGESLPVYKKVGDNVISGTINKDSAVNVKVSAVGLDTTIARIANLVENAKSSKTKVENIADRISAVFVPIILSLSLITFLGSLYFGVPFKESIYRAIAVIVVACPCALGLAVPMVVVVSIAKLAKMGILIKNFDSIHNLNKINAFIFDKTGTLTTSNPKISHIFSYNNDYELLELAASTNFNNNHPLSGAILEKAKELKVELKEISDYENVIGFGVKCKIDNNEVIVGSRELLEKNNVIIPNGVPKNSTIFVSYNKQFKGCLVATDDLREESRNLLSNLNKIGIKSYILSGDSQEKVELLANSLGNIEAYGNQKPKDKVEFLENLKANGKKVAFVGDGVNDSAALALADTSIAMGSGSAVAIDIANVVLMRNDIGLISDLFGFSKIILRRIIYNLAWAFSYNIILIPLAMFGIVSPVVAAIGMSFSSVAVVLSSLMLVFYKKN